MGSVSDVITTKARVIGDIFPCFLDIVCHAVDNAIHGGILLPGQVIAKEVLDH